MTTATSLEPTLKDALAGYHVIDCDSHWSEPADLWTAQAPASLKDRTLHIEHHNGVDHWVMNGESWGNIGGSVVDSHGDKIRGKLSLLNYENIDRAGTEPKARVELLDKLGVWAQIMYPNAIGFGATKALRSPDVEARNFIISGYNNGLAQMQAETNGRVLGQAVLPFWDLKLMCKEAIRCVEELKLKGFTMVDRPEGFGLGIPDLGDPHWDPFFELVNELKVPINFHIGSGNGAQPAGAATIKEQELKPIAPMANDAATSDEMVMNMPLVGWESFGPQRRLTVFASLNYMDNARIVSNLILSGLLDKWPNIKWVSVESGVGWVPGLLEALEYQLYEMCPDEAKLLKRSPREYFLDQIYACWWFESFGPTYAIKDLGPNNFLFETDFPHPTCLYPDSQKHIAKVMAGLTEHERQRMLQDNGAELYKIDLPTSSARA